MIISKEVEVKIGSKNYKLYKELGYVFNRVGDIIKIKIEDVSKGSHSIVEVKCDYCGKLLTMPYKSYNSYIKTINKISCSDKSCSNNKIKDVCNIKYGVDNPFQMESVKTKSKETLIEKYGVEHPMHLEATKDKIKDTCLKKYGKTSYTKTKEFNEVTKKVCMKKYGVDHSSKTKEGQQKRKTTRIKNKIQLPDNMIPEYLKYRRIVDNLTEKIKKELFNNWNGYDYYDNEYIKDNFNLNSNSNFYPSMDHKISVFHGFTNNINPEIIADLYNLCITKRKNNSSKSHKMNSEEYKEKMHSK